MFLLFKPTDLAIGFEDKWRDTDGDGKIDPDNRVISRREWSRKSYMKVENDDDK